MEEHRIHRDNVRFFGAAAGVVVMVGGFAAVFSRMPGGMLIILGLMGLVACLFAGYAMLFPGVGFCPECGTRLSGLALQDNEGVRCRGCDGYATSKGGLLSMAGDDSLAATPTFRATCPTHIQWPDGCCVCGDAVSRHVEISLEERASAAAHKDMAVRVASMGTMKLDEVRMHKVSVPHCDKHGDGARLERSDDADGAELALLFRWNDYRLRFEALNE